MGEAKHSIAIDIPQANSSVEVEQYPSDDVLEFRRQFVINMGWFDETHTDDRDRYDEDPSTIHFAKAEASGGLLSTMRLTGIGSLRDSLSVEMLESNEAMHRAAIELAQKLDERPGIELYDLTRLTHYLKKDPKYFESVASILPVFGAGLACTEVEDERELLWVFTTTASMKTMLDKSGIKSTEIARGKISAHDKQESYFCVIHPAESMRFLLGNQDTFGGTYELVNNGYVSVAGKDFAP